MLTEETKLMHERMIESFLDIKAEYLEGKNMKEILWSWVNWMEDRYKVTHIPGFCYGIIDCEHGGIVTMIPEEVPDAKEKALKKCEEFNLNDGVIIDEKPPFIEEINHRVKDALDEKTPITHEIDHIVNENLDEKPSVSEENSNMINADEVKEAYLTMDDEAFIDFLMNHTQEK